MKLYYFFGRMLKVPLTIGFHLYCLLTRTPRVRVVVQNESEEILLVKSWTSSDEWGFPGGGVDRGESYETAACRELSEETGITASEDQLTPLGSIHTWGHEEILFSLLVPRSSLPEILPSRYEIKEASWFSTAAIPHLGPLARQIIAKVATNH